MRRIRSARPARNEYARSARLLWYGFALLATYVSIYPADFQVPIYPSQALLDFFSTCCGRPGRGDVLGNVILFVPFGALGMLAAQPARSDTPRIVFVGLMAAIFAFALQVAQIGLPSRDENLQDVVWNLLGTGAGIPIGLAARRYALGAAQSADKVMLVPWLLIAAWLAYRLIPFVPSIDFQGIKDALKPLLLHPQISIAGVAHDTVAWLLIARFVQIGQRQPNLDALLPLAVAATFALEILIVANTLSASNVLGAALALALWFGLLRRARQTDRVLAAALMAMLVFVGLAPFETRDFAASFNWLPFKGFLGGSMYINAQSACEKFFLYGSLVYVLWRSGLRTLSGTAVAAGLVLLIELLQTRFAGHTPEITDAIIVGIAALVLVAFGPASAGVPVRRSR